MLSATSEHALRAVLFFAQFPEHTTLASDTVAAALGAPRNYLAKTLNALAKAGVLRSSRGPGGGFSLAVPPTELTIARVIAPFAENPKTTVCLLRNRPCDPDNQCAAHAQWTAITHHHDDALSGTTMSELLGSAALEPAGIPVTA